MIIVTVNLVLDVECNEAADAVNEILREHQQSFSGGCLLDYSVQSPAVAYCQPAHRSDYFEGDAFVQL